MSTLNLRSLVEKLNPQSHRCLEQAAGICVSRRHYDVELEHLLLALMQEEHGCFYLLLQEHQINRDQLTRDLNKNLEQLKLGNELTPAISARVIELLNEAWLITSLENSALLIHSGFLLQALLQNTSLKQMIYGMSSEFKKLSLDSMKLALPQIMTRSNEINPVAATPTSATQNALSQYTINLNEQAKAGKIDPVIGREDEIRQMMDILSRRRQNNAILTGEPGVGKTAIVEGLALNIVNQQVPDNLKNTIIYALDIGLLQAGAGVKGEFENRLKNLISEIKQSNVPIILFIDEAHMLIGAGNQAGAGDAANLLKPALARGELRSIAATTWSEYKQYFEKDAALTRRFQVVKVEEPDAETTVRMLRSVTPAMEKHHNTRILDTALHAATKLSSRYITGRFLPDKAVSVIDTACARAASKQATVPATIERQQKLLEQLHIEKKRLIAECKQGIDHEERLTALDSECTDLDNALQLLQSRWQQEKELVNTIKELSDSIHNHEGQDEDLKQIKEDLITLKKQLAKVQQDQPLVTPWVDSNAIAEVIADWTGVPVGNMLKDDIKQILNLKSLLQQKIVGQDHALAQISETMQASAAKLTDPSKPLGVFLFVGPSGVGKTETALNLAEALYGSPNKIVTINMSEFKEEHKVSMLLGAPPGYVGYGEGGVLTEAVRRKPYTLILLDEMEKAHPGVHDIFYQVFDKGTIKDGQGREIDFKNTVIIMTSNACSEEISNYYDAQESINMDHLITTLQPHLTKIFKPAFLGRVRIVPYLPLSQEVLEHIIDLKLAKLAQRTANNQNITLSYEKNLIQQILEQCHQQNIGARQIDTIINTCVVPSLSQHILESLLQKNPLKEMVIKEL